MRDGGYNPPRALLLLPSGAGIGSDGGEFNGEILEGTGVRRLINTADIGVDRRIKQIRGAIKSGCSASLRRIVSLRGHRKLEETSGRVSDTPIYTCRGTEARMRVVMTTEASAPSLLAGDVGVVKNSRVKGVS